MGPDGIERLLAAAFWPLLIGGLAAFLFLALLASAHLRSRALLDLCRRAVKLREEQEETRKRIGASPLLARTQRFEKAVRNLLSREGFKPPTPPPVPSPKPATRL